MIGLSAVQLQPLSGGIGTYILHLLVYLEKNFNAEEIKVYFSKEYFKYYSEKINLPSMETPLLAKNPINRILTENLYWNAQLKKDSIRLFHSPISYLPFFLDVPAIVTVHDLRVYNFPETYPSLRMQFLKRSIKHSLKKAKRVITVSNFTKSEILNNFYIDPNKIHVIKEGIDYLKFQNHSFNEKEKIQKKYNIKYPYIFSVGHLEPRKNYIRLIKAFKLLLNETNEPIQLVISGIENFKFDPIFELIEKSNLFENIIFTGFIPEEDLLDLYKYAEFFVIASIYEGFGFPPLEALATGTPVVASNVSSLPEILENSALFFNPYSIEDMANKLKIMFYDRNLKKMIVENGKSLIKKYNWTKCGEQTILLYKECLKEIL